MISAACRNKALGASRSLGDGTSHGTSGLLLLNLGRCCVNTTISELVKMLRGFLMVILKVIMGLDRAGICPDSRFRVFSGGHCIEIDGLSLLVYLRLA